MAGFDFFYLSLLGVQLLTDAFQQTGFDSLALVDVELGEGEPTAFKLRQTDLAVWSVYSAMRLLNLLTLHCGLILGLLLCFSSSLKAATNLVVNGGFVSTLSPWVAQGMAGEITLQNNADRDTDGDNYSLKMLSGNTAGNTGSYIYQVVAVTPNLSYLLNFDARVNGSVSNVKVDIFNGDVSSSLTNYSTGSVLNGGLYQQTRALTNEYVNYGSTFVSPTSGFVTIRFSDLAQTTVATDIWLDNVVFSVVPEPSRMMLIGLALGTFLMRRKRH